MRTTSRSYAHKVYGQIGTVTMTSPAGDWTLNGQPLPERSVDHLLTFALQTLQDAYAGADSTDAAKKKFDDKLAKLIAGTLGVRSAGGAVDEETRHMRIIMRSLVAANFGKLAWKAMEEDEKVEYIDAAYDGLEDADRAAIDEAVAEAIAAEKRAKGLSIKLNTAKK